LIDVELDEMEERRTVGFRYDRPTIMGHGPFRTLIKLKYIDKFAAGEAVGCDVDRRGGSVAEGCHARELARVAPVTAPRLVLFHRSTSGSSKVDLVSPTAKGLEEVQVIAARDLNGARLGRRRGSVRRNEAPRDLDRAHPGRSARVVWKDDRIGYFLSSLPRRVLRYLESDEKLCKQMEFWIT
jgi:hypothetical protein